MHMGWHGVRFGRLIKVLGAFVIGGLLLGTGHDAFRVVLYLL